VVIATGDRALGRPAGPGPRARWEGRRCARRAGPGPRPSRSDRPADAGWRDLDADNYIKAVDLTLHQAGTIRLDDLPGLRAGRVRPLAGAYRPGQGAQVGGGLRPVPGDQYRAGRRHGTGEQQYRQPDPEYPQRG
jgi:hypothetical protein